MPNTPKNQEDRWREKVVAARKAVAEAEQALVAAADPVAQTLAFRELQARTLELRQALMSRT